MLDLLVIVLILAILAALAQALGADSRGWGTDEDTRPWI
jgi:hypothetical protein